MVTVSLRYKKPKGTKSKLVQVPVIDEGLSWNENSRAFKFSAAVAGFSMILRESKYINDFSFDDVMDLAKPNVTIDELDKVEFLRLVENAKVLGTQS